MIVSPVVAVPWYTLSAIACLSIAIAIAWRTVMSCSAGNASASGPWPPKLNARFSHQSETTRWILTFSIPSTEAISDGFSPSAKSISPLRRAWIIASWFE